MWSRQFASGSSLGGGEMLEPRYACGCAVRQVSVTIVPMIVSIAAIMATQAGQPA